MITASHSMFLVDVRQWCESGVAPSTHIAQYVAVRYTERLAQAGAVASVGSTGDSYDNAMAEALNSLLKAELVRNKGPCCGHRRPRDRRRGVHRLVQPPAPAWETGPDPARGIRDQPSPHGHTRLDHERVITASIKPGT